MPALELPSFPDDVPTHPLLVIDYQLISTRDSHEIDRLWEAATKLGFCLKNHGVDKEVDGMFDMGAETMKLPLEEKLKFEQGDDGMSFGYNIYYSVLQVMTFQSDTRPPGPTQWTLQAA
ncbi:hypothetical protein C0993_007888 [Termitomyces sp. T159_Od127]|nr:hypothetical protein C0993_007888 [Termitomyces sp. T159_Od127]